MNAPGKVFFVQVGHARKREIRHDSSQPALSCMRPTATTKQAERPNGQPTIKGVREISDELGLSSQATCSKTVLTQEVGNELVLLDMASEQYLRLDPIGARV